MVAIQKPEVENNEYVKRKQLHWKTIKKKFIKYNS